MMATTIMSSIKVNPERRFVFFIKESPARNVRLMRCLLLFVTLFFAIANRICCLRALLVCPIALLVDRLALRTLWPRGLDALRLFVGADRVVFLARDVVDGICCL
jgi:hypothetical protein